MLEKLAVGNLIGYGIFFFDSADERFDTMYPTNVVILNDGSCSYIPPGIIKSTCKIDITWFPFDAQNCTLKYGSWTYDGSQIDLRLLNESGADLSAYVSNGEWDLIGKNVFRFICCFQLEQNAFSCFFFDFVKIVFVFIIVYVVVTILL